MKIILLKEEQITEISNGLIIIKKIVAGERSKIARKSKLKNIIKEINKKTNFRLASKLTGYKIYILNIKKKNYNE
ncbi:hypothetical protein [Candidatus Karelsulcia muelleri]|uniref:hypothetical protein n=1 Tax=Candidatus Karelsulcia muelleri TaxID=336810 RepID=UPI0013A67AD6|nr:hypothetical protein [Candidatus Karelsulcia muelleri]